MKQNKETSDETIYTITDPTEKWAWQFYWETGSGVTWCFPLAKRPNFFWRFWQYTLLGIKYEKR